MHGTWHMQSLNDDVTISIPGYNDCKLHSVKFFFMNEVPECCRKLQGLLKADMDVGHRGYIGL